MGLDAEPIQQKGIDGVALAKRGLESTTWIELPFNAYRNDTICRVQLLNGTKLFDMFGFIFGESNVPLYVEAKNYDGNASKLDTYYKEFLANAYSATALAKKNNAAERPEFMFVTTHPFGLGKWVDNFKPSRIREALTEFGSVLGDAEIDDNVLKETSDLVHLLILNERQERFMLTPSELNRIEEVLGRKAQ
ncbi:MULTISPECIES: hypothetical protein [Paenarthrobacter]|uniref:hypothetical protein n=1 Tax=Paenarthrobacter TaxID=1742992 RepID=UPI002230FD9B|nr:hypothetical protein [Paenarthrobacter sp. PAE-2]MCW3767262.1 hypothetical protein [Paenarthrobacter sp. PAE-2]